MNADTAYKNYLKGKSGFPNFKRRNERPVSIYLPRNNPKGLLTERYRVKIPTLGWVRLKEYGYIPCQAQAISVTITKRAGRYFASFLFETDTAIPISAGHSESIGIDLGVKSFAVISDGRNYSNINKSERARKLIRRLKREQRKFSRKIHKLKQRKEEAAKKCKRSNLDKQRLKVQRAYMRLSNKRHDYIKKTVHEITSARPEYITIENLKLSDRVYECTECGLVIDRDYNAAINLRSCKKFCTVG